MQIQPLYEIQGEISSSPSKSYSHRAFALALCASNPSFLINPLKEGDVAVTIDFCLAFGGKIEKINSKHPEFPNGLCETDEVFKLIPPPKLQSPMHTIDGKNSGTSIRLMSALASLLSTETQIVGTFFQRGRPLKPLMDALAQIGVEYEMLENPPGVKIRPKHVMPGPIDIPGDISSQFITGLMTLAPSIPISGPSDRTTIKLTTPAKSYPYLQITEEILATWGILCKASFNDNLVGSYEIMAGQRYPGRIYRIPGDFSSAAFMIVLAALNPLPNVIKITNLDMNSPQGDKDIVPILKKMGAQIEILPEEQAIQIEGGHDLHGISIDCSQMPDLFPILAVLAVFVRDRTVIHNAAHVRIKETDRIKVMVRELQKMGAVIEEKPDGIVVEGPQSLKGCEIQHDEDHRIAMAMIIAALFARSPSKIQRPEVVADSYPDFLIHLKILGIQGFDQ
jgi:3-phosphoshikimate 1-carboxyvinyltransferase